jgi:methylmalonyl-CoA mutase
MGDRIRMNAINNPRVYMRSLATSIQLALSKYVADAIQVIKQLNTISLSWRN